MPTVAWRPHFAVTTVFDGPVFRPLASCVTRASPMEDLCGFSLPKAGSVRTESTTMWRQHDFVLVFVRGVYSIKGRDRSAVS